jgi:uncharacterized protein DUF5753
MGAQLERLTALETCDRVTVQVAALHPPWPAISTPFTVLRFADRQQNAAAYIDGPCGQKLRVKRDTTVHEIRACFAALTKSALPVGTYLEGLTSHPALDR